MPLGRGDTGQRSPKVRYPCQLVFVSDTKVQREEWGVHLVGQNGMARMLPMNQVLQVTLLHLGTGSVRNESMW
jgi:hypothetical protein